MTLATERITAEQLLAMGDIGRCELIYGEIVRMSPTGSKHGLVAMRFARHLGAYADDGGLGLVFGAETGFKVESNPDLVRAPDACFIAMDHAPGPLPDGYWRGVPDLAVEVVSPDDTRRQVAEKVNMWLAHGTSVVWVADPATKTLNVHRTGRPVEVLSTGDTLCAEPLLPGFELPVADVFKGI